MTDTYFNLMRQANMTASEYFDSAVRQIDKTFGVGHARNHPELVRALVDAAARDYETACANLRNEAVVATLRDLSNAIRIAG